MRDIARLAGGVHPSTVSLALHNHQGISKATRKRIQGIARKIGYRRDPMIDAFNRHRLEILPHKAPQVIAYLTDFPSREAMEASPAHCELWTAARGEAKQMHCQLDLFSIAEHQMSAARMGAILRARGISSLILGAFGPATPCPELGWADFSVVRIEGAHIDLPCYAVSTDHRRAARSAFKKLLSMGYQRIGLATDPDAYPGRNEAYLAAALVEYAHLPEELRIPPFQLPLTASTRTNFGRWLNHWKVGVVLTDDINLPSFLARGMRGAFRQIPWACLDLAVTTSAVGGMIANFQDLGVQAVRQVISLMRVNERGLPAVTSNTLLPARWVEGDSVSLCRW
jgi:LacI family transcriptional regulator